MIYSNKEVEEHIEEFRKRVEEDRQFCEELFELSTINILAHKYLYYIMSDAIVNDEAYDCLETSWYIMGRGLGAIAEDATSPCVDFNYSHPLADKAIAKANKWRKYDTTGSKRKTNRGAQRVSNSVS